MESIQMLARQILHSLIMLKSKKIRSQLNKEQRNNVHTQGRACEEAQVCKSLTCSCKEKKPVWLECWEPGPEWEGRLLERKSGSRWCSALGHVEKFLFHYRCKGKSLKRFKLRTWFLYFLHLLLCFFFQASALYMLDCE